MAFAARRLSFIDRHDAEKPVAQSVASSLTICVRAFERILPDANAGNPQKSCILMCTGKIYFDLDRERERLGRKDVAILRLEQLYPLADDRGCARFYR